MALFAGERDMSLFRRLNKELINDIIDTEIYYYKTILSDTKANIYGEADQKVFYNPVKISCLIDRDNRENSFDEFGSDYTRNISFYFLRDTLVDLDMYPEIGDVIEWNGEQHMVDGTLNNQYFAGKNPKTWDGGDNHGYDISILCITHVVRKTQLKLNDDYRVGIDKSNNENKIYK
jgi:hypothetical protein